MQRVGLMDQRAAGLLRSMLCMALTWGCAATAQPRERGRELGAVSRAREQGGAMLEALVAESSQGLSLSESKVLSQGPPTADQLTEAERWVAGHPDHRSYHLLFLLREHAAERYERLPADLRARVLTAALGHLKYLNDWGYLDPAESYDGKAAKALLALGAAALPHLRPLLTDRRPAPLFGSEEATMSHRYQYRRADFAARYVALILGEEAPFAEQVSQRDRAIATLMERLGARK
jgi:hypothetical protein